MKRAVANILSELFILVGPSPGMRTVYLAFLHYCFQMWPSMVCAQFHSWTAANLDRVSVSWQMVKVVESCLPLFLSSSGMSTHPFLASWHVVVHNKPQILESDNQRNLIWRSCCDHLKCCDSCPPQLLLRAKLEAVE